MIHIGVGAPSAACPPRGRVGMAGALACALALTLAGCGGGGADATSDGASPTATNASPSVVQLEPFPDGSTYWRSAGGAPVIAYKSDSQLCFFYWAGLGYMPTFVGSVAEVLKQWNWSGIEGRYGFGDSPPSTSAVTLTLTPGIDGTGSWNVDGVFGFDPKPVAEGSPDPASDNDLWVPSSAEQAAADYVQFLGLPEEDVDVPTLEGCPATTEFR